MQVSCALDSKGKSHPEKKTRIKCMVVQKVNNKETKYANVCSDLYDDIAS